MKNKANRIRKRRVTVHGTKVISEVFLVRNPRHAVEIFRKKHGFLPNAVGDRNFVGFDKGTGKVILGRDEYHYEGNGVYILDQAIDGKGKEI